LRRVATKPRIGGDKRLRLAIHDYRDILNIDCEIISVPGDGKLLSEFGQFRQR